jgi:ABC-type Fe3+-hydroxamate transport system substrate-binding protein
VDTFFQPAKRLPFLMTFLSVTLLLLLSACGSQAGSISNSTPPPTATVPPAASPSPFTGPYQFTAQDSGRTVTLYVTSRMTILLNEQQYPRAQLLVSCSPQGVLGTISNVPFEPPPVYAVRYEAVRPGACTIKDSTFLLTVRVYYSL